MNAEPGFHPPPISPVPSHIQRPLWSVMIPAYNCAHFLAQTLESVLAQDPGPAAMQIEVIDDCSTKDDPQAVVQEIGQGRVDFYRQPQNVGVSANFNTCIARSRGHLVHILHGDDFVLPGFYRQVADVAAENKQTGAFFVRSLVVDEEGVPEFLSRRVRALESPSNRVPSLYYFNQIFTPSAVIRRSFYEQSGGFITTLVHAADWEMWVRAIETAGGLMINEILASYRTFGANHTSQMQRTGENARDFMRLADIWTLRNRDFDRRRFQRYISKLALRQAREYAQMGDAQAAAANRRAWRELTPRPRQLREQWRALKRKILPE